MYFPNERFVNPRERRMRYGPKLTRQVPPTSVFFSKIYQPGTSESISRRRISRTDQEIVILELLSNRDSSSEATNTIQCQCKLVTSDGNSITYPAPAIKINGRLGSISYWAMLGEERSLSGVAGTLCSLYHIAEPVKTAAICAIASGHRTHSNQTEVGHAIIQ